jgi:hypothetical protein
MSLAAALRRLPSLGSAVNRRGTTRRGAVTGLTVRRTVSVTAPRLTSPASPAALRVLSVAALSLGPAMTGAVTFTLPLTGAVTAARSVATALSVAAVTMPAGVRGSARFTSVRAHVATAGGIGGGVCAVRLFAPPLAVMDKPGGVVAMPVSQGF